ncbi:MAG TPA: hypothetical protein VGR62_16520 [Candidatus Binatia bacterium]|jgi:hypothetical protein|nr:hypothetical protein [Candidatus Binatia bacterium]
MTNQTAVGRPLAALLLALLVIAGGCRRTPVGPLPIPAPRIERRSVELENGLIALELVIPLDSPGPKPTLIGLPALGTELFAAGIVSLSYRIDWTSRQDAPLRMTPFPSGTGRWLLASPSPGRLGERYLRSIAAMADIAIPRIIDYLETLPVIDRERIAVGGTFTDGFIALQALAHDERLAAGVVIGACGDYRRFLHDSSLGANGGPLTLDPSYDAWLTAQEVVRHPERVVPAPLLLVNRVDDPAVPIACADETARALAPAYAAAGVTDHFRQLRLDGRASGLGPEERKAVMDFLARRLVR